MKFLVDSMRNFHYDFVKRKYPTINEKFGEFWHNGYAIKPNFLDRETCDHLNKISNDLPLIQYTDLRSAETRLSRYMISIITNTEYYWAFPNSIFDNYKYYNIFPLNDDDVFKKIYAAGALFAEEAAGTYHKLQTSELYRTLKSNRTKHLNANMHLDDDFKKSVRVLIYLTDVSPETGGELIINSNNKMHHLYGPRGTAICFAPSLFHHAGAEPKKERLCLNLKYCPTLFRNPSHRSIRYLNGMSRIISL